jgi:hypothetical protein
VIELIYLLEIQKVTHQIRNKDTANASTQQRFSTEQQQVTQQKTTKASTQQRLSTEQQHVTQRRRSKETSNVARTQQGRVDAARKDTARNAAK